MRSGSLSAVIGAVGSSTCTITFLTLAAVKHVLSDQKLWRFSFLALTFQLVWHRTVNCFTPILVQRFSVTSSQLGAMTAVGNLGHLVASAVIGSYVLPKQKASRVFGVGFLLMAAIVAATAFSTAYWMLLALQFFSGVIGYSVFLCALTHCVKEMPDADRGIAVGMTQAIYGAGMFIGPSGLGQLLEFLTLEQEYLIVSVLCLLAAWLGWKWAGEKTQDLTKI